MRLRSKGSDHHSTSSRRRRQRLALALALASGLVGIAEAQTGDLPNLPTLAAAPAAADSVLLPYPFVKPTASSPSAPEICRNDVNGRSPGQRLVELLGLGVGLPNAMNCPTAKQELAHFDSVVMCQASSPAVPEADTPTPVVQASASMPETDTLTNSTSNEGKQPSLIEIDVPLSVPEPSLELQLPDEVLLPAIGASEPALIANPSTGREPQILQAKKSMRITIEAPASPIPSPTAMAASMPLPADGLVQAAAPIRPTTVNANATNLSFSDRASEQPTATDFNFSDTVHESPQRAGLYSSSASTKRVQASKLDQPFEQAKLSDIDEQTGTDSSRLTDQAPPRIAQRESESLPSLPTLAADSVSGDRISLDVPAAGRSASEAQASARRPTKIVTDRRMVAASPEPTSKASHGIHLQISSDTSKVVSAVEIQDEDESHVEPKLSSPAPKNEPAVTRGMQVHIAGEPDKGIPVPSPKPLLVEAVKPPVFTDRETVSSVRQPEKLAASQPPSVKPPLLAPASLRNAKHGEAMSVEPQDCINFGTQAPIIEISVEQPNVCQLLKTGDRTLSVIGLQPGSTRIAIVTRKPSGEPEVELREVTVTSQETVDAGLAQYATVMSQAIARLYPQNDIQVIAGEENLIVRGIVASESDAKKILSLVRKTSLTPVVDELQSQGR
jgi:hypothetical protein